MTRRSLGLFTLIAALLITGLLATASPFGATAQTAAVDSTTLFRAALDQGALPAAPSFIRLLRINMEPGAVSPLHTHPGPELWRIESGTVTVFVQGPTLLAKAGKPDAFANSPQNAEFELGKGDQIVFLPGTAMTFTNKSTAAVRILASVILPAGHQHPAGITYVGGQPGSDAFKGISSDILGDGVASALPIGKSVFTIERLKLGKGQALPETVGPTLYSVAKGGLAFTVTSGNVQVSRTAKPGPQPDAAPNTPFTLARNDGFFFPDGASAGPRAETLADVQLLRLTIVPDGAAAAATPAAAASPVAASAPPAVIAITGPEGAAETPAATAEATQSAPATQSAATTTVEPTGVATTAPTEPTTGAETPTAPAAKFEQGATVYVLETDVRLRDAPSTDSNILTGLTQGQALIITGPAVVTSTATFYPVQDATDATFTGYVAEQFLSLTPP